MTAERAAKLTALGFAWDVWTKEKRHRLGGLAVEDLAVQ
jgi:hypothetical protein